MYAYSVMPRAQVVNTRIQRAFAPLIVWAPFQPERVFPSTFVVILPWCKTFLPHVGAYQTSTPIWHHIDTANDHLPTTKIKHPSGECGRNPSAGQGFQLKETLQLSDGLYEEILVIYFAWSVSPYPHLLMLYTGICSQICDAKPECESDYH